MSREIVTQQQFKKLSNKDLEEGKEIFEIYTTLDGMGRLLARIYINALSDRRKVEEVQSNTLI